LRAYLCACPAATTRHPGAAAPGHTVEASGRVAGRPEEAASGQETGGQRDRDEFGREGAAGVGLGGGGGPEARLHVCAACAHLKPQPAPPVAGPHRTEPRGTSTRGDAASFGTAAAAAAPAAVTTAAAAADVPWKPPPPPLRVLELCCGTGASLAFMHGLGCSVVGVELVAAAAGLAARRLAEVGRARVAVEAVGGAEAGRGPAGLPPPLPHTAMTPHLARQEEQQEQAQAQEGPTATVLCGDLFSAQLPHASFDFVYDCQ
ncbi:hypothetical protein TSOC_015512, partial [Tetrabaena socialis]